MGWARLSWDSPSATSRFAFLYRSFDRSPDLQANSRGSSTCSEIVQWIVCVKVKVRDSIKTKAEEKPNMDTTDGRLRLVSPE